MRGLIRGSGSTTLVVTVVLVASTACNVPQEGAMDNGNLQTLIESLSQSPSRVDQRVNRKTSVTRKLARHMMKTQHTF